MKKILYISDVNSNEPIFHSQVLPHIEELRKYYKVILVGMRRNDEYPYDYAYSSIKGDYVPLISYFNFLKQKNKFRVFIKSIKIDLIYSRGYRGGLVGSFVKMYIFNRKIKLVNDVRGDAFDEDKDRLLTKISFYFNMRIIINNADVIFFVSSYLRNKYLRIFKFNLQTAICPTFVPNSKFVFDQNKRDEYRQKLGYKKEQIVLLYSGNLAKWQNVDVILDAFSNCTNKNIKLLFLTKDKAVKELVLKNKNKDNIMVLSVDYNNIHNYHFASDYGLLIRDNTDTNRCSSPTKFSEYINSGLVIISTDIEADYVDFLKQKQLNMILINKKSELELVFNNLERVKRNAIEINTVSSVVELQNQYFSKLF